MTIPSYRWSIIAQIDKDRILSRSETDISQVQAGVATIIDDVKNWGDKALRDLTAKFDSVDLTGIPFKAEDAEFVEAEKTLDPKVKAALDYAIENVTRFHEAQVPRAIEFHEIRKGILAGERARPLDSVGLYVPRGRGSFPSMLYMLAIPAKLAGVKTIAIMTPPGAGGTLDPACLYAANKIGVRNIYRVGGAQAIAALAYGTESIPRVLKVVGPGSQYVTAAKRLLAGRLDPGLPAGPSESILWADCSADPRQICLDLLVEAEHGADSSALLVTDCPNLADEVGKLLPDLINQTSEPRKGFLSQVFSATGYGGIILADSPEACAEVVNTYAPEHLSIQTTSPWDSLGLVRHAGEILLGSSLPFSAANYVTGANAVLPTGGYARTWSGVSVRDFLTYSSVVQVTPQGYKDLKDHVVALADYEGFPRHAAALKDRYST